MVLGVGVAAVLAGSVWAVWPSPGEPPVRPDARVYSSYSACLLTDSTGLASFSAAAVWRGMEGASTATSMRVSYLPTLGRADAAAVRSYLNTLVVQHCEVIVAIGAAQTSAASAGAKADPGTHFVVVRAASTGLNVASVTGSDDDVAAGVKRDLIAANAGRFGDWASGAKA